LEHFIGLGLCPISGILSVKALDIKYALILADLVDIQQVQNLVKNKQEVVPLWGP
jgi:hypothetical protein